MSKIVLITGASEGIGRYFAHAFAKDGYQIRAVARNQDRLALLLKELPGSHHSFLVADLSNQEGVEVISKFITENKIDILVNNAGFGGVGEFLSTSCSFYESMIDVNVRALLLLSHTFLKSAKPGAALINVSSVLGYLPAPFHGVYAATKAFVKVFSESLWFEQKNKDIYVMCLCPGATETEFNSRAGGSADRIPKFLLQKPQEVVAEAMTQLYRRSKPIVVTGRINKLIKIISWLIPNKNLIQINGKQAAPKANLK